MVHSLAKDLNNAQKSGGHIHGTTRTKSSMNKCVGVSTMCKLYRVENGCENDICSLYNMGGYIYIMFIKKWCNWKIIKVLNFRTL